MDGQVTVLLAAYKGNAFAGAQIESILAQDTDAWHLVLSDDGTDTAALLEGYARRYPEKVEHHRSGRRFGSSQKHFLYLLEQYREAPYVMFCDQDDVWHPDKIRLSLEKLQALEAAYGADCPILVHTDLRVVDAELHELDPSFCHFSGLDGNRLALRELVVQNMVTGCTVMMNRALTELVLLGKDASEMRMHDGWAAMCAAAFGQAAFLPVSTMDYRQHGGNVVGAKNPRSLRHILQVLKKGDAARAHREMAAQAGAFLRLYEDRLQPDQKALLEAFAGTVSKGKCCRLRIYSRYGLWKKGFRRRLGQLLFW